MGKKINIILLAILSILLWLGDAWYPNLFLKKSFYTALSFTLVYLIFRLAFEEIVSEKIKDSKTKYAFKKTVSIIYLVVFFILLIRIWVEDTQALLVTYGLITAGIAITLQDVFKNFVGGIIIFVTGIYRVGDRIELDSKYGDVIDIGILYTTLMELKEWVGGEQATGRLTIIPNGRILSNYVNSYTKDHNFIWEEINIPITYDSDWKEAIKRLLEIVRKETLKTTKQAELEISNLEEKYYLPKKIIEPAIFLSLTDNWINLSIRYTTEVRERRLVRNKLSQLLLKEIEGSEDIKIASQTLDITAFPELKLKKE